MDGLLLSSYMSPLVLATVEWVFSKFLNRPMNHTIPWTSHLSAQFPLLRKGTIIALLQRRVVRLKWSNAPKVLWTVPEQILSCDHCHLCSLYSSLFLYVVTKDSERFTSLFLDLLCPFGQWIAYLIHTDCLTSLCPRSWLMVQRTWQQSRADCYLWVVTVRILTMGWIWEIFWRSDEQDLDRHSWKGRKRALSRMTFSFFVLCNSLIGWFIHIFIQQKILSVFVLEAFKADIYWGKEHCSQTWFAYKVASVWKGLGGSWTNQCGAQKRAWAGDVNAHEW